MGDSPDKISVKASAGRWVVITTVTSLDGCVLLAEAGKGMRVINLSHVSDMKDRTIYRRLGNNCRVKSVLGP